MVRNGEACDLVFFDEDDVATSLTGDDPAKAFEDLDDLPTAEDGQTGHSGHHLDFAGLDRQGQATLGADLEAKRDGFFNIPERFFLEDPWLTHPGMAGHSTTHTPSSSRSKVT
jgi:hypothetical protein